ncbi:ribonuclease H-like domain-containing protein [Rhizophagus irregularis DAOM 181602=DAOM 197198]|nr:ribonuclease H-like domain-containing protein [Rhizophagus irregularis DAOM 181602=DAOM 197198]
MTSTLDLGKIKNKGGRPPSSIWEDITRGNHVGSGKYHATCKYCNFSWSRGDVTKLEEHLANHCSEAPALTVRKYLTKVLEREDKINKKRKIVGNNQLTMTDYHDSTKIPDARITRINCALAKFFVACDQLLERELAMVNSTVASVIENGTNLTLAFDGWTSPTHRSIWNFVIMTPSREEYLFKLQDLSDYSHTGNYVAEVIGEVIDKIGPNKISAVVSDNASNVRNARKIIEEKYPNIENVRCIAHAINLITCDILKESFGDRLLRKVNTLGSFFKNSHQAGARLTQLIKENSIHGGGMKLYCKTRWTTASELVDSIIRLEPVLEQIATNNRSDLRKSRALCEQIKDYHDNKPPFDHDESCSLDDPLNWWNLIDTDPQPNSLPRIARHLLAICPNSASCERGFSTLGWLFNDQRLNLNINQLESMGKMIMHWKSNAKKELGFYGIEKNNTRISETEMNLRIAKALAETNDDDDECDVLLNESLPNQITIPPDNCIVLIEHIWIDKFVDLSHKLVIEEVGEIPDDILDDSEEEYEHINTDDGNDEEQESDGRGNYDYDVEKLLDEFINEDVEDYEDE